MVVALSTPRFFLLLTAALAVTMSYGVTLPVLPVLLPALDAASPADVSRQAGWLTGVYTAALFVFSPLWGRLSDRVDRRWVISGGLVGSAAALWPVQEVTTLTALYALRIGSGAVSAAVLPAVFAYVVQASVPAQRQRRFAWVASATALGFLLGPVAAERLDGFGSEWSGLRLVALLCALAAVVVFALPAGRSEQAHPGPQEPARAGRILPSLVLTAMVVFGITVAEVGLTLALRDVALYLAICSATMVLVQLWAYPLLERRIGEHRLVTLSFAVMALGVALLARPGGWSAAAAFLLSGSAIGVLIPALAVRISLVAGERQGSAMGAQAAAANLGQALGAAATGMLFAAAVPLPFLLAAAVLATGAWAAGGDRAHPALGGSTP